MLKIQVDKDMSRIDCTISILFGDFNTMKSGKSFTIFISMLKEYLCRNDVRSLSLSICREDYGLSMVTKCVNCIDIITCPEEWKGKINYKRCRQLLKVEGLGDFPFYFRDYDVVSGYFGSDILFVNM